MRSSTLSPSSDMPHCTAGCPGSRSKACPLPNRSAPKSRPARLSARAQACSAPSPVRPRARARISSAPESGHYCRAGQLTERVAGQRQLRAADPAADNDPGRGGHGRVHEDRPVRWEADRGNAAILHRGLRNGDVDRSERRLPNIELTAHDAVDVSYRRGEEDARGEPGLAVAPPCDHDAVGRLARGDAVALAECRCIGELRINFSDTDLAGTDLAVEPDRKS